MTELDLISKSWQEMGTEVYPLEKTDKGTLFKTTSGRFVGTNKIYDPPVYQIFDSGGKRILAITNYRSAHQYFMNNYGG